MVKEPSYKIGKSKSVAESDLYDKMTTPEAAEKFEKGSSGFISLSLVKIWKNF